MKPHGTLWAQDGSTEVAVKVVRKEFFKQDPKVKENLEREIRILKLLRGCEYVVQVLHVQVSAILISYQFSSVLSTMLQFSGFEAVYSVGNGVM